MTEQELGRGVAVRGLSDSEQASAQRKLSQEARKKLVGGGFLVK